MKTRHVLGFVAGTLSVLCFLIVGAFGYAWYEASPAPPELLSAPEGLKKANVFDREGHPLALTLEHNFNYTNTIPLTEVPSFLKSALLVSEDKHFLTHHGVDWSARLHALYEDVRSRRAVRGARTITEQVASILTPRPRSVLTRLEEGIEATRLEGVFSKYQLLEFYLNQVPFARKRRGIVEAARFYFNRDVKTLSKKEMAALVVMIRAPSRFDLVRGDTLVATRVAELASRLEENHVISGKEREEIENAPLIVTQPHEPIQADHFVRYVLSLNSGKVASPEITTTLDGNLQVKIESLLQSRLRDLRRRGVTNGAVLIVENATGEVRAWVNGGAIESNQIDAVRTPRQPGSTLKPFVYARALERGWTGATILLDAPLSEAVGSGIHQFKNYSRVHYGPVRLREALGNSLNIPVLRAVKFIGDEELLSTLHRLGFSTLTRSAEYYGDALALGDAEVSLFDLVQAYSTLARGGVWRPLKVVEGKAGESEGRSVIAESVASTIGDILADPNARRREFGGSTSLLRFPTETAVKTGTSSDYRDAWALGFTSRYTVGVWMGDLRRRSMAEVSGAQGPALLLRSVIRELDTLHETPRLKRSPELHSITVCAETGLLASDTCPKAKELFTEGQIPTKVCAGHSAEIRAQAWIENRDIPRITFPTPGLIMAFDPRIPEDKQSVPFEIEGLPVGTNVVWSVDRHRAGESSELHGQYLWNLVRGTHRVGAKVCDQQERCRTVGGEMQFYVR